MYLEDPRKKLILNIKSTKKHNRGVLMMEEQVIIMEW